MKAYKNDSCRLRIYESYGELLRQWGVPVEERDIPTRYGTTHVVLAGDENAPPLVLFHGVGDNSAIMWYFNARMWTPHFRLAAVDTLGGPGKSVPGEGYGPSFDEALWIDDTLDCLGLNRVCLAGISHGAVITQCYAARRPARTVRAVCMAAGLAAGERTSTARIMLRMMKVFFPEALAPTRRNALRLAIRLCGEKASRFTGNVTLMEHWRGLLLCSNKRAMRFHRVEPLTTDEIGAIRAKTLFILGDRDPLSYSPESVGMLDMHAMNYRIVKGAGHAVNYEEADLVGQWVTDFLTGHLPGRISGE